MNQVFCARCMLPITKEQGGGVSAGGGMLHHHCFTCQVCNCAFADGIYYPDQPPPPSAASSSNSGLPAAVQLLCATDYAKRHNLLCAKCGAMVAGRCLSAANRSFHPDCFTCDRCDQPLSGTSVSIRPSGKYCKSCIPIVRETEKFAAPAAASSSSSTLPPPRPPSASGDGGAGTLRRAAPDAGRADTCSRCRKPFQAFADVVVMDGHAQHAFHFTCGLCRKEVDRTGKQWESEMYCGHCYEKISNAICAACGQSIRGRSVTAMGLQFHPEHFVCVRCLKSFPGGEYFELDGEPYCKQHYHEQRGDLCGRCFVGPVGQVIVALNRKWCEGHFRCFGCDKDLADTTSERAKFMDCDDRPYCKRCYDTVPFSTRKNLIKYEGIERKAAKLRNKGQEVH